MAKRNFHKGKLYAELLITALLKCRDEEFSKIGKLKIEWEPQPRPSPSRLRVNSATLADLVQLTQAYLPSTNRQEEILDLLQITISTIDQEKIRNALSCLFDLNLAEDRRVITNDKTKTNSPFWYFAIKHLYLDESIEDNIGPIFNQDGIWDRNRMNKKTGQSLLDNRVQLQLNPQPDLENLAIINSQGVKEIKETRELLYKLVICETQKLPQELSEYTWKTLQGIFPVIPEIRASINLELERFLEKEETVNTANRSGIEELVNAFFCLGKLYIFRAEFPDAERCFNQAYQLKNRHISPTSIHLFSLHYIALTHHYQGRLSEAMSVYSEVVELSKEFKFFDETVSHSFNNLGLLLIQYPECNDVQYPEYKDPKSYLDEALGYRLKNYGANHILRANSLNSLGRYHFIEGQYEEAKSKYQEAIELIKKLGIKEHKYLLWSRDGLAEVYTALEKYDEAETQYQESINLTMKINGDRHYTVALRIGKLASIYYYQARKREEESLLDEAKALYLKAEQIYDRVIALLRRICGEEYIHLADFAINQALACQALSRICQTPQEVQSWMKFSKQLALKATTLMKRIYGENHPKVKRSYRILKNLTDSPDY